VSQTHPVEPANNAGSNISQGDNMVPSDECFFLRDTCSTGENFPDSRMALGVVTHRIDRIPFFTPFFAGSYIHQYGHTAG
jgi:hypothetical protein